ncbi:MAG: hypothetical protein Q8K68_10015, partial [Nitrospirota bacterium]|nr:hypothetical protein [Nitrospirota bacterium]
MKIRTKLWVITILPFVFFLGGGLIGAYTNHLIDNENEKTHIVDDIRRSLDELTVLTHEYFVNPVERAQIQWQKRHASLRELLAQASERFDDAEDRSSLRHMNQSHETIEGLFSQFVMTNEIKAAAALELRERLFNRILQEFSLMGAELIRLHEKSHEKAVSITKKQNIVMISFFAALSAFIFIVVRLLNKGIIRPIEILHKGTEYVGSGNLDYKVGTDVKDEIG